MNSRRFLVRLLLAGWLMSSAAVYGQSPAPPGSTPTRQGAAEGTPGYVVEQQFTRLRFERDGRSRRDVSLRVKVQDEQAVRVWGQLPLTYNSESEELTVAQLEVQKPDGSVIKTDPSTMQDVAVRPFSQFPIFMDLRQKIPTIASFRPGDTLTLRATWTTTRPTIPGHFVYAHRFNRQERVDDERLEIDVPADRPVNVKMRPDGPAEVNGGAGVSAGDRHVFTWNTRNAVAARSGDDADADEEHEGPPADVRLTTFQTWEDVARWYRTLLPGKPNGRIAAKAVELTKGMSDRTARIIAIYGYVSTQIRYVSLSFGLGRYAPHPPADVLSNQYGDCKDKGVLLTALLAAAGIESVPVLISTTRSADADFPSPLEFDHLITMVPGDGGGASLWLDPTLEVAPPGLLSMAVRDRRGLLISTPSRIVATPADPPFESLQRTAIDGKVNALGWLDATVTLTTRGDAELIMRSMLRALPKESWAEFGKGLARGLTFSGDVSGFDASDPADTKEPFRVSFQLRQRKYLDWAAATSEAVVPSPAVGLPGWTEEQRGKRSRVDLGQPGQFHVVTTVQFPAGYELRPPVDVTASSAGVTYAATYRVEGGRVVAERTLRNTARHLPAERFGAYAAFVGAVNADTTQKITVRGQITGTPAVPEGTSSVDAYDAALSAYNAKRYDWAVALWEQSVKIDPKFGDAWISLGLAYDKLGKFDQAAAAIQKQIDLDPYNKRAYGDLGHVLSNAKKQEAAAQAYAKHVELNPLDGAAFEKLGDLYMDLHRYSEVVPVFERAVALNKPDGWTYAMLGQSYLYTQQREKGLKAFDRALDLNPSLAVMRRIAWVLAETGHEPGRARDLAQRLITRVSEDMRSISLPSVRQRDIEQIEHLVWAWDTLALLELSQGDLAVAEKYAHAAWLLFDDPDIAEHIGRIYDKQGRAAEALNYFALARYGASKPPAAVLERTRSLTDPELEKTVRLMSLHRIALVDEKTVTGRAYFLVVVGANHQATAARFVKGDAAMEKLTAALQRIVYPVGFPDSATSRLLVPLEVRCMTGQGCAAQIVPLDSFDLTSPGKK